MARKSSIDRLSPDVKAHIERRLAEGQMTLDELIGELRSRWPEQAAEGELPSRSAVGRYGQKLQQRLAAIKASTEAAKIIQANAGDDHDARSEAVIALVQTELFESIVNLQEAGDKDIEPAERIGLLSAAAKNIATLARASVNQKKFRLDQEEQARIQREARAAQLAEQEERLQEMRGADGMSEQMESRIRRILLGKE